LITIEASLVGNQLQLRWTYSENLHQRDSIASLADTFMQRLDALIAHCQSPDAGEYTPSDFKRMKLDQQTLDKILKRASKTNIGLT